MDSGVPIGTKALIGNEVLPDVTETTTLCAEFQSFRAEADAVIRMFFDHDSFKEL
jgi:hypothetical protein